MAIEHTSYYRASVEQPPRHDRLQGPTQARVCVVGGGYAGLNTALGLAERGCTDVLVMEARQLAFGASGRNGGFVFGGFSAGESALLRRLGPLRAARLYQGTRDAVDLIRARIGGYSIECEHTDEGVLWANWFRDPRVLQERQALLAEHFDVHWQRVEVEALRELVLSKRYHGALLEKNALHMNPVSYAHGLAKAATRLGVRIHERTPATSIERIGRHWRVYSAQGQVECEHLVLACGGYLAGLRADVDAGVLPIATYVMVTEPLGARMHDVLRTKAAVYDSRFAFDYYRPLPDTRLLWGGRISVFDRSPAAVSRLLRRDMLRVFPQLEDVRVESAWSGLMSYARHEMPQIGRLEPGLWLAQAFGGHGVAPTTFAGETLAAAIVDGDLRWQEFADYPLVSAMKPASFAGAQLSYWWLQARDAWKAWAET